MRNVRNRQHVPLLDNADQYFSLGGNESESNENSRRPSSQLTSDAPVGPTATAPVENSQALGSAAKSVATGAAAGDEVLTPTASLWSDVDLTPPQKSIINHPDYILLKNYSTFKPLKQNPSCENDSFVTKKTECETRF
jgi:hypothetical protein